MKALASIRAVLTRFRRDEQGATIALVTVMIVTILGFAAMVTDAGTAYWNRRLLQNGVDSASLAGAQQLARNLTTAAPTPATATSQAYALDNGLAPNEITSNQVTTTFEPNDTVVVNANRLDNYGLRYVIGAGDANIDAGAAALVAAILPNTVWPFGITVGTDCSAGCVMKAGANGNAFDGNFGLICFQLNGCGTQDNIVPEIKNGYSGVVPTPTSAGSGSTPPTWNWPITTEPGNKLPSAGNGVQQLLDWDAEKACVGGAANSCFNLYQSTQGMSSQFTILTETSDQTVCVSSTSCPRVGIVPLIQQSWSSLNGNSNITVVGFACFYLTNLTGNGGQTQVYGTFLRYCMVDTNQGQTLFNAPLGSTGAVGIFLWR